MKWLKEENGMLISPPTYDKTTGLVNCHLNETWLINNGYTQWTNEQIAEWNNTNYPSIEQDTTAFNTACGYFRQICGEIGDLMGVSDFRGGYDDMPVFYAHESYKTDKGMQLAIAWSGCNDFCNHEASKLGIGSPDWWYRCWGEQRPLYYNFRLVNDSDSPFYGGNVREVLYPGEHVIFKHYDSLSSVPENVDKDIIPNTGGPVWIGQKDDGVFIFAYTQKEFRYVEDSHGNIISENVYREIRIEDASGAGYEYFEIKFRNENSYDIVEFEKCFIGEDVYVMPITVYE